MSDALETKVKSLENEVVNLKQQLQVLQDIEDIKRLQCAYGYYLDRWMSEEIIDCFANNPEVSGTFVEGTYKGPEGIRAYFPRTTTWISPSGDAGLARYYSGPVPVKSKRPVVWIRYGSIQTGK